MGKKLGLAIGGIVLIGLFLAWMLLKGTSTVQVWIDPNPSLGFVAWGIAWLCVLGGATMLARAVFRQEPSSVDDVD